MNSTINSRDPCQICSCSPVMNGECQCAPFTPLHLALVYVCPVIIALVQLETISMKPFELLGLLIVFPKFAVGFFCVDVGMQTMMNGQH